MNYYNNDTIKESFILVGVELPGEKNIDASLDELERLIDTAGAEVVGRIFQKREYVSPATYVGKGKIDEIKALLALTDATGIVCDDELSPAQFKNLEDELDVKVMDRTLVILDIFAQHATTSEGKIQVEMAQLKYRATRLAGFGNSLSRLGGGIGTRGPGEKKIEVDRRRIHDRISQLKKELSRVERVRETNRKRREDNRQKVAAIVGYTNAGKSTLLNRLTAANVLSENKLFATLDPTTRALTYPTGKKLLMTDTVGFIRKLPHNLVEAFKSTLEEAKYADIIIHVVDSSNPDYERQMETVYSTLESLGVSGKPIFTLFNKADCVEGENVFKDPIADKVFMISAKSGTGIAELREFLEEFAK